MDKDLYYIALHLAKGLSHSKKQALLRDYSIEEIFHMSSLREEFPIRDTELQSQQHKLLQRASKEFIRAEKFSAGITHIHKPDYPKALLSLHNLPIALYYKGRIDRLTHSACGIVGSRTASTSALNMSYQTARLLSQNNVAIISGLAKGIDAESHHAALDTEGFTLAVLGCGLDKVFPREHAQLQQDIAELGCVISEFSFGEPPRAFHFPQRNRIISGLACGVLVVECGKSSGALYTARFAFRQGREVYVYPGDPHDTRAQGNIILQQEGASLIHSPEDLMRHLSRIIPLEPEKADLPDKEHQEYCISDFQECSGDLVEGSEEDSCVGVLDVLAARIYTKLSHTKLKTVDQLVEETGITSSIVMQTLTNFFLQGLCNQYGNAYTKNKFSQANPQAHR